MNIELVYTSLVDEGIQVVVALPDSGLAPLCRKLQSEDRIDYIQVTHESDCVGISTGLTLTGVKSLVIMENSGLRNACETIARFHLSHQLFTCYLISHRGAFGDQNWWGQAHHETMEPILEMLHFRWESVNSLSEFPQSLRKAYSTLSAGQSSVALIAEPDFIEELRQ